MHMSFTEEIKKIRQRSFLIQQDFAKKIGVFFHCESLGIRTCKSKLKSINLFYLKNNMPYEIIEGAWLNYKIEKIKEQYRHD